MCHIWSTAWHGAKIWTLWKKRSEMPGKFWNVVLEKDGEDQLDQLCEKWSTTQIKEEKNILHVIKKEEGHLDWLHLA
jgi:hypothetical protein